MSDSAVPANKEKQIALDSVKNFVAGTMSGFAGKTVEYPFDTVKVLLQTQDKLQPQYRGAIDCFVKSFRHAGFFGLYKGMLTPLLGSAAENAILFTSYGWMKYILGNDQRRLGLGELALAGAGCGVFVSFVLTPVELIKCRLQVQVSTGEVKRAYSSPLDVIRRTLREEGVVGLYRGHAGTLMREVPGNFAWFGVYETACGVLKPAGGSKEDMTPLGHMAAGACAGMSYWTAFFPADVVKSRMQTDPHWNGQSFARVFSHVFRTEGLRGLYAGWGITVARAAPSHAVIFATYELVSKLLR
eukprot:c8260_g1_i1.p1 GENE.c8260_g1_i1~~c8260_g1_i1.p1  ORF type:complete len:300 (-),score=90.16 c8260_g1_i1:516-1415(-)